MPCNCFHYATTQLMNKFNLWCTQYLARSRGQPNGRQELCNMRAYLPGNRLQHLLKSERSKKTHPKLQPGPALPVTATDSTSNENLEAELPVLGPSYNTRMKSTKFKAVAYKLVQFSSHLLLHRLFTCFPDRGPRIVLWNPDEAVGIGILQPTALQTTICFSRKEQLHDAAPSFTFSGHSCQLTQQQEVANPVPDPLQLCLLLQWWCYKGLHRHCQREKNGVAWPWDYLLTGT